MSLNEFEPEYLSIELRGAVAIARFKVPRLTEEVNLEQLGHELFAIVEQHGCRKLVLSFNGIEYLTSGGLGKLITLHRKMHRHEGVLAYCELPEVVDEIVRMSKLDMYFNIVPNLDNAIASLQTA